MSVRNIFKIIFFPNSPECPPVMPPIQSSHHILPSYPPVMSSRHVLPSYPPAIRSHQIQPSYPPITSSRDVLPSHPPIISSRHILLPYPLVISSSRPQETKSPPAAHTHERQRRPDTLDTKHPPPWTRNTLHPIGMNINDTPADIGFLPSQTASPQTCSVYIPELLKYLASILSENCGQEEYFTGNRIQLRQKLRQHSVL